MARLIFTGEKFSGRVYEFALLKTTVGRGDHNTLVINDASVSLSQCEVLVYGPEVIVRDLGSSNGTFVNGVKLFNEQRQLKHGQTVRFGSVEACLDLEQQPSPSDTATAETAIFSHVRHLHDRDEDRRPGGVSMKLEPHPDSPATEHTLPPAVYSDQAPAPRPQARPEG
jgi:hypothetical protein